MPITSERAEVGSLTMLLARISAITLLPITAVRKRSRGSLLLGNELVSVTGRQTSEEQSSDPDGAWKIDTV